jgi:hypothetical protein
MVAQSVLMVGLAEFLAVIMRFNSGSMMVCRVFVGWNEGLRFLIWFSVLATGFPSFFRVERVWCSFLSFSSFTLSY